MSDSESEVTGKRWIMPVLFELFALPFAWISVQMLHDKEAWKDIFKYAVAGIVLSITGVIWAIFRDKVSARRKSIKAEKTLPASQAESAKPEHNVQFTEFKAFGEDSFTAATLLFRNVPKKDLLLGKFNRPRLRVIYYEHSTGQEIDDFYSVTWWDEKANVNEIDAMGRGAIVAAFLDKWSVCEDASAIPITSLNFDDNSPVEPRWVDLPFGKIRIVATLYGNYAKVPALTVNGVLTLNNDGTASFERTTH